MIGEYPAEIQTNFDGGLSARPRDGANGLSGRKDVRQFDLHLTGPLAFVHDGDRNGLAGLDSIEADFDAPNLGREDGERNRAKRHIQLLLPIDRNGRESETVERSSVALDDDPPRSERLDGGRLDDGRSRSGDSFE